MRMRLGVLFVSQLEIGQLVVKRSLVDTAHLKRHLPLVPVPALSFWIFESHLIATIRTDHHQHASDPITACQLSRAFTLAR